MQVEFQGKKLLVVGGTSGMGLATARLVLERGGGAAEVSWLGAAFSAPVVIGGLVGGIFLDRFEPRKVLIVDNAIRGLVMASIPVAAAFDALTMAHLFVAAGAYGLLYMVSGAGLPTILPRLLAGEELVTANAMESITWNLGGVGGPVLAGLLIGLTGVAALVGLNLGHVDPTALAEVGVTCSVGVAPTKLVAKIASQAAKPDGVVVVPDDGVTAFLEPLPVERLWGVGEKTLELLHRIGVRTIADLAATSVPVLGRLLGDRAASGLRDLARGIDERDVVPYQPPKQVSNEETFERDLDDDAEILRELLALAHTVGGRLREDGYRARTVVLKVRSSTFTTVTRSRTLPDATDVATDLFRVAGDLYRALPGERHRIRLLGIAATNLVPAGAEQLALLHPDRWGDVERALDRVDRRFGRGSALPARLLDRGRDD